MRASWAVSPAVSAMAMMAAKYSSLRENFSLMLRSPQSCWSTLALCCTSVAMVR
ncbi:hypothetical protein D3C81_2162330 [compost metagenome]